MPSDNTTVDLGASGSSEQQQRDGPPERTITMTEKDLELMVRRMLDQVNNEKIEDRAPKRESASEKYYSLLLSGGVYDGSNAKMVWSALGQKEKFKGQPASLADPEDIRATVESFGTWLSTFHRPAPRGRTGQPPEDAPTLAEILGSGRVHLQAVTTELISVMPPEIQDPLKAAVRSYSKSQGNKATTEGALRKIFASVGQHTADLHQAYYKEAHQACLDYRQGDRQSLLDYAQTIRVLSDKTATCENSMYIFDVGGVREQASILANLNTAMKRLIEQRVSEYARDPSCTQLYSRIFCADRECGLCPEDCMAEARADCCFAPLRALEREFERNAVVHAVLSEQVKISEARPKSALKERGPRRPDDTAVKTGRKPRANKPRDFREKFARGIMANNVELQEMFGRFGEKLDDMQDDPIGKVQDALIRVYGSGDENPKGPKGGVPNSETDLLTIGKALRPNVGVCFTCFSRDHRSKDCPLKDDTSPDSWTAFQQRRTDVFHKNKKKSGGRGSKKNRRK